MLFKVFTIIKLNHRLLVAYEQKKQKIGAILPSKCCWFFVRNPNHWFFFPTGILKGSKRSRIATLKGTAPRISDDTNQRRSLGNRSVRSPEHRAAPTDPALKCQKLKATKTRSTGHQQCQKASENLAVFKISNGRCLIHSLTTITSVDMVKLAPKPKTHWSTSRGQGSCWGNFLLELSEAPGLWGRGRRTVPSRGVWKVGPSKETQGLRPNFPYVFLVHCKQLRADLIGTL